MTKRKIALMITLTMILSIMTLGYAALQEKIDITGGASVDSVYKVEITKMEQTAITGNATEKETPSYTGLTANFSVGLTKSTDSISYNIEISNLGTVDVKLNNAQITTEGSNQIKVSKSGIANGDILLAGESKVMTIKISYTGETEMTGNITINLDYTRLKGGTGQVVEEDAYTAYSIGDQITFAGSNWYVIKDSTAEDDYVTLMKETVLTNAELGEYATRTGSDTMAYYYSDTCHWAHTYGYTSDNTSGCSGHNDYAGSKVKEFLEGTYINTLGSDNLKEVSGYKIRLITVEELRDNLGWANASTTSSTKATDSGNTVPLWVYQNFGDDPDNNNVYGYWTMTLYSGNTLHVWRVTRDGKLEYYGVNGYYHGGVRPVINLLKSSI